MAPSLYCDLAVWENKSGFFLLLNVTSKTSILLILYHCDSTYWKKRLLTARLLTKMSLCLSPLCLRYIKSAFNYILVQSTLCTYVMNFPGGFRRANKPRSFYWHHEAYFLFQGQSLYSVLWSTQVGQYVALCSQCKMWSLSSHSTEICLLHHNMQQQLHLIYCQWK